MDWGYTKTEAVVDGTVGEGARANVASKPEGRTATHCATAALAKGREGLRDEMEMVIVGSTRRREADSRPFTSRR